MPTVVEGEICICYVYTGCVHGVVWAKARSLLPPNPINKTQHELAPFPSSTKEPLAATTAAAQDEHLLALLRHLILPRALMSPEGMYLYARV